MEKQNDRFLNEFSLNRPSDEASKSLVVLRSILTKCQKRERPVTFGKVYKVLKEIKHLTYGKSYVHRILRTFIDSKLVRYENLESIRNRYTADIQSDFKQGRILIK